MSGSPSDVRDLLLAPLVFGDGRALPCRIFPGPMDGVTEGSFLSVLSRNGYVRSWHTPFIRISTGVPGRGKLRAMLAPFMATGLPVTAQVMGLSGERLAATAARLHELGAVCVDLNCACPSPTVVGNGSGGARLRDIPWLRDTLCRMREACGVRGLSVKLRIGFDSPEEFGGIAEAVKSACPDMVIVHYRTVRESYRPIDGGLARLKGAVTALAGIPVIGSGDLFTVEDCLRMVNETGVAGVAPARGLMRNPRLLLDLMQCLEGRAAEPPVQPAWYLQDICRDALEQGCGRDNGFVLRLAGMMLGKEHPLFRRLAECHSVADTLQVLEEWSDCER